MDPSEDVYRNLYGKTSRSLTPGAANADGSAEGYGPQPAGRGAGPYGANDRNRDVDPYLSMYRYGTTNPNNLRDRYAPSGLSGLSDPSASIDPDLSMYRYGATDPYGSTYRSGSADLSANPYALGETSDDDTDASLGISRKSRDRLGVWLGDDDAFDVASPYPAPPLAGTTSADLTPQGAARAGADGSAYAPASAVAGTLGLADSASADRAVVGAPRRKPEDKAARAFGELEAGAPRDAPDRALGFDPYDAKSILGVTPAPGAGKRTAASGAPPSGIARTPPIMGTALPSSVGPNSVGPSAPGMPDSSR